MQLDEAQAAGTARSLAVGEVVETTTAFVVYGGLQAVTAVVRDGERIWVR
jgi:hypothetical protein